MGEWQYDEQDIEKLSMIMTLLIHMLDLLFLKMDLIQRPAPLLIQHRYPLPLSLFPLCVSGIVWNSTWVLDIREKQIYNISIPERNERVAEKVSEHTSIGGVRK